MIQRRRRSFRFELWTNWRPDGLIAVRRWSGQPLDPRERSSFTLREESLEHVFRDRSRGGASMPAVLDEHDTGDLRVIARREEDE